MISLRRGSAFCFDFDGTLVDSSSLHDRAFRQVLSEHIPELLADFDYESMKGKSTREAFVAAGVCDPEAIERFTSEKQRCFRTAVRDGQLEPIAGAHDLLATLRDFGHQLFLVTSGSRGSVTLALASTGLSDYFAGIITADDVERTKPSPDPFLRCMSQFSLTSDRSVVVEDAPSGVAAARAAGLAVIGVNNPAVSALTDLYFSTLLGMRDWAKASVVGEVASI